MNELSLKRFVAELQVGAGAGTEARAEDLRKLSTDSAACIIMWPTIVYHMQRSMAYRAVHLGLLACRLHFAVFPSSPPTLFLCVYHRPPAELATFGWQRSTTNSIWMRRPNSLHCLAIQMLPTSLAKVIVIVIVMGHGTFEGKDSSVLTTPPLVFECLLSCLSMSLIIKLEIS